MRKDGGMCPLNKVRHQADGHKQNGTRFMLFLISGRWDGSEDLGRTPSHRCSQAAAGRTATSLLKEDMFKRNDGLVSEHHGAVYFVVCLLPYTFEGDKSALSDNDITYIHKYCIHWYILTYQVSLVTLGSKLREGRGNSVFQQEPETADGCTS